MKHPTVNFIGESYTLFLDTTLLGVALALIANQTKQIVWKNFYYDLNGSVAKITSLIQTGLQNINKDVKLIKNIVVSEGPGSFTGIKVGLSWANGFASAASNECLLKGVSSFELAFKKLANFDTLNEMNFTKKQINNSLNYLDEQVLKELYEQSSEQILSKICLLTACTKSHGFIAFYNQSTHKTNSKIISIDELKKFFLKQTNFFEDEFNNLKNKYFILGGDWPLLEQYFHLIEFSFLKIEKDNLAKLALRAMVEMNPSEYLTVSSILKPRYHRASTAEENLGIRLD